MSLVLLLFLFCFLWEVLWAEGHRRHAIWHLSIASSDCDILQKRFKFLAKSPVARRRTWNSRKHCLGSL